MNNKAPDAGFWDDPDEHWAVMLFNGDNQGMHAVVKNGLALLKFIPQPETGYHFMDVVTVDGPVEELMFRDDPVNVYRVTGLHQPSGNQTFRFAIRLASNSEYDELLDRFRKINQLYWLDTNGWEFGTGKWISGLCSARNIDEARNIFEGNTGTKTSWPGRLFGKQKKSFDYRELSACN